MKLKPRDRGEVYDQLYRLAHRLLDKGSACATCPIACKSGPSRSWCCSQCKHLGPRGCTVKALACSLWLCHKESGTFNPRLKRRLDKMERIARHYRIYTVRGSKEESLAQLAYPGW